MHEKISLLIVVLKSDGTYIGVLSVKKARHFGRHLGMGRAEVGGARERESGQS